MLRQELPNLQPEHPKRHNSSTARARRWRCPACLQEFRRDKQYRLCGFHPNTRTFVAQNRGCATLSRLRWVLRQNGVQLLHDEHERSYSSYSMGITDPRGDYAGRLQGVWLKGIPVVTVMQVIRNDEPLPLHYDTALSVLQQFKLEAEEDVRSMSADFTR